jgi:hypothetical protein
VTSPEENAWQDSAFQEISDKCNVKLNITNNHNPKFVARVSGSIPKSQSPFSFRGSGTTSSSDVTLFSGA